MRNTWGKRQSIEKPYYTVIDHGVELRVLKVYGDPRNPYARAFTWGRSEYCKSGEFGDTYCNEIPGLIDAWASAHEEES